MVLKLEHFGNLIRNIEKDFETWCLRRMEEMFDRSLEK
jgi:hypothetical protein